jgi:hypothetical protein
MTLRVLYITGWRRSGSTLLGNLLNEVSGVVHVGELHYLWQFGRQSAGTNTSCGCGQAIPKCPLWHSAMAKAMPGAGAHPERAQVAMGAQRRYLRTRHTRRRLAEATGRRKVPAAVDTALERITTVYRAVAEVSGSGLVVDSSKFPAEAAGLCGRTDVDVRVLHLVRDPRATAHSWRDTKDYIPAIGMRRNGAYWTAFNAASDRIGRAFPERYMRLRYEDFVSDPAAALSNTLHLAGLSARLPIDRRGFVDLGVNHTVTGNPNRLSRGVVQLRPDEAWRRELPTLHRRTAALLAGPLMRRYGYH